MPAPVLLVLLLLVAAPVFGVDTVTTTADSGTGSLREVLARPGASTINFAVTGQITLTSGAITIGHSMTIMGPGATNLSVSGNNASRIFNIPAGVTVVISNLTVMNGRDSGANGQDHSGSCNGFSQVWTAATPGGSAQAGAMRNSGVLRLYYCLIVSNAIYGGNGGSGIGTIPFGQCCPNPFGCTDGANGGRGGDVNGGAIYNDGTLLLLGCTLAYNSASGGQGGGSQAGPNTSYTGGDGGWSYGGAIYTVGSLAAANCTFTGNASRAGNGGFATWTGVGGTGLGGALEIVAPGTAVINNCTVSGNGAYPGAGYPNGTAHGGGFENQASVVQITSTIVSGNSGDPSYPEVSGAVSSLGFNLIARRDGSSGWIGSDLTGTSASPLDPLLGPLQMNGGPTPTRLPQSGSKAIDNGSSGGLSTDQRGLPRTVDLPAYASQIGADGTDIGAVEVQATPAPLLDIGLRAFDGSATIKIACTNASSSTPFRISKNGQTYGIALTATNATDASKIRIRTSSGIKAWVKLP